MSLPSKPFTVRLTKEMWVFLKEQSIKVEKPANQIITKLLEKYKKRCEKQLTQGDTAV